VVFHFLLLLNLLTIDDREYSHKKANYRDHILNVAKFKQVIPITHKDIISKINLTYRVQYLKDVVIARLMDDGIFSTFNSIIFYNHLEILTYISQDHSFLSQLFTTFNSDTTELEQKRDVILFLNEMCSTAKSLPNTNRNSYYRYGMYCVKIHHKNIHTLFQTAER
jgi:protein phosphatase-4 regulatory subunit 3